MDDAPKRGNRDERRGSQRMGEGGPESAHKEHASVSECACVRACVRACMRARVRACVRTRACVRACVRCAYDVLAM